MIESIDEHSFAVHILKAEWSGDFCHALGLSPVGYSLEQCLADSGIINEVEPTEPYHFPLPVLVGAAVDDRSDTSGDFPVLEREETMCLTESEGRV